MRKPWQLDRSQRVKGLENTMKSVQSDLVAINDRVALMESSVNKMDNRMKFINSEVNELKGKTDTNLQEIKALTKSIMYQEVYNRRENLRFLGIPESDPNEVENTGEVVRRFLAGDLELDGARDVEFQRVHRMGKKKPGVPRPIIACFLRYPDRERVFKRALEMKDDIDVTVYADLPKEIQESRKKQLPRLKRAREGKLAFFCKKEPDKLYIDGEYIIPRT